MLNKIEARAGIEPTYEDLQSSAWPLCHRALDQPLEGGAATLEAAREGVKAMGRPRLSAKRLFFRKVKAINRHGAAAAARPSLAAPFPYCRYRLAMKFEAARRSMIDSQLRPNKVTDQALLDAMAIIPREEFVPAAYRSVAYVDEDV